MRDEDKTKEQLVSELVEMRQRIAELEAAENERVRAQEALRESEEKYRALSGNSPNGIFISDAEQFIYVNQRFCEITGFSEHDLLNVPDPVGSLFAPEERERVLAYAQSRLSGSLAPARYKARGIRKDGEDVWLELAVSSIVLSGKRMLQGTVEDITERVRAEEALRAEKEFSETMLDTMLDTVFVFDPSTGKPLRWNEAFTKISGYTDEEIASKKAPDEWYSEEDLEKTKVQIEKLFRGEKSIVELSLITNDGRLIPTEYTASMIRDAGGNPQYIIAVGRDITERARAEEQIKASLREKEVLLKEIHHRVKNNLAVISALLNLQSASIQDPLTHQMFQESQHRIQSMAHIHEHLYRSQDLAWVDMAEYIQGLGDYLHQSYGAYAIALKIDVADVALDIDTAVPCGLIINELVSNAMKHAFPKDLIGPTGSDGKPVRFEREIRIALHSIEDRLELVISDNGVGLTDLDLENLASLGLRVVSILTAQLEGALELDGSDGTTFKIAFPAPTRRS